MSTDNLRDEVHERIGQLDAGRLAAVVRLLEVLVHDDQENEEISVEEEAAVARSKEWFRENDGIPFEHVVADLGLAMDEIREAAGKDPAV